MRQRPFAAVSLAPLLLLALLHGPTSAPPVRARPTPPPAQVGSARYGIPRLGPGELWISSVPVGLEVRNGGDPNGKQMLGRTPLVVNARKLGDSITVIIRKKEYGGKLPDQLALIDFSAKRSHSMEVQYGPKVEDLGRAITYGLNPTRKQTLIALFQSRDSSLSELARFYPRGSNFQFSHGDVERRLAEKGVPPQYIQVGIGLLERGGKVGLPGTRGWLIAEVTASGRVDLLEPSGRPPG